MQGVGVVGVDRERAAEAQCQKKAVYIGQQVVDQPHCDVNNESLWLLLERVVGISTFPGV